MKHFLLVSTVVSLFIMLWYALDKPAPDHRFSDNTSKEISSLVPAKPAYSANPSLSHDNLQIEQKHDKTILIPDLSVVHPSPEPKVEVLPDSYDESYDKGEVIEITLSPQQTLFYEEYHNSLNNDKSYLWNLNLHEFTSQEIYISLPKDMKMLIMGQIMQRFREGKIDKQKFLMVY